MGKHYPELSRLRCDLEREDIALRLIDVDYEFFAGTGTTLILSRPN